MKEARYYALNLHSSAVIELGVMKESEAYPTLRKKIITECETKADGLKLFNLME